MNINSNYKNDSFVQPTSRALRFLTMLCILVCICLLAGQSSAAFAQQKPTISGFSPSSGSVGTVVTLSGTNFNRDIDGNLWSGSTPPYQAVFPMSGGVAFAPVTFVSATQIRTTVPFGAVTAPISLRQGFSNITTSASRFIVVAAPPQPANGSLRVVNNTQYDIVSLKINGQEKIQAGTAVALGTTGTLNLAPGNYSLVVGMGFANSSGARDIWFTTSRNVSVTATTPTTTTISPLPLSLILTGGAAFKDWQGEFFDNNGGFHLARLRFQSNGSWQLFQDNVLRGSGSTTLVSWPNRASTVQFRIAANQPTISISFPFASFFFRNGPASFPTIQYTKQ